MMKPLVLFALLASLLIGQSQPPARAESGKDNQSNRAPTTTVPDWWAMVNTGLMTVFTGGLVWLMFRQWGEMGRQAQYMREGLALTKQSAEAATLSAKTAEYALHLSERADVLIRSVTGSDRHVITNSTNIIVTIKNVGRTRATGLTVHASMLAIDHYRSYPAGTEQRANMGYALPTTVGPGEIRSFPFGPVGRFIDNAELGQISIGAMQFCFQVALKYRDVFEQPYDVAEIGLFRGHSTGRFTMVADPTPTWIPDQSQQTQC